MKCVKIPLLALLAFFFVQAQAQSFPIPGFFQSNGATEMVFDIAGGGPRISFDTFPAGKYTEWGPGKLTYDDLKVRYFVSSNGPLGTGVSNTLHGADVLFDFDLARLRSFTKVTKQRYMNWLVKDVTFPPCDVNSYSLGFIEVTLTGGNLVSSTDTLFNPKEYSVQKASPWVESNFQLVIPGVDCSRVSKIDAFTMHQRTTTLADGTTGTYLDPGDFSVTMPAADAQPFEKDLASGTTKQRRYAELYWLDFFRVPQHTLALTDMAVVSISPAFSASGVETETVIFRPARGEIK